MVEFAIDGHQRSCNRNAETAWLVQAAHPEYPAFAVAHKARRAEVVATRSGSGDAIGKHIIFTFRAWAGLDAEQ
jgi:hypothetical protein